MTTTPPLHLDGALIRRRRNELGLSTRAVGGQVDTTSVAIVMLESGLNHDGITMGTLVRLAQALAVDPADLLRHPSKAGNVDRGDAPSDTTPVEAPEDDAPDEDTTAADAAAVGAILHTTGVLTPLAALADVLDWPGDRVSRAVDHLDQELRRVGLRLHRLNTTVSLRRAVDAVDRVTLAGAVRRHLARDGIGLSEARALRQVQLGTWKRAPSNAENVALGVLTNAGLVTYLLAPDKESEAPLVLADEVCFSLMLDDGPPATTARGPGLARTRSSAARRGGAAEPAKPKGARRPRATASPKA